MNRINLSEIKNRFDGFFMTCLYSTVIPKYIDVPLSRSSKIPLATLLQCWPCIHGTWLPPLNGKHNPFG